MTSAKIFVCLIIAYFAVALYIFDAGLSTLNDGSKESQGVLRARKLAILLVMLRVSLFWPCTFGKYLLLKGFWLSVYGAIVFARMILALISPNKSKGIKEFK